MQPTGSPFKQPIDKSGPGITPKTMASAGQGGQANPSYLQMRSPSNPTGNGTRPVITPKPTGMGDTVAPSMPKPVSNQVMPQGLPQAGPNITPASGGAQPPQAGGEDLNGLYNFFKSDLQNQTKQAKSGAIADASARGVYYGTPLTGSEADIDTQYLRGLGQLQSGMYGNEQQDQLSRLGMATNLIGQSGANAPPVPGDLDLSSLGMLFGSSSNTPASPAVNAPRQGPVITKNGEGGKPAKTNSF